MEVSIKKQQPVRKLVAIINGANGIYFRDKTGHTYINMYSEVGNYGSESLETILNKKGTKNLCTAVYEGDEVTLKF